MKSIEIKAYGKINLSLDVLGNRPDGYHEVEMIMQQIMLHDFVIVSLFDKEENTEEVKEPHNHKVKEITVEMFPSTVLNMEDNLAYKAAILMRKAAISQGIEDNLGGNQGEGHIIQIRIEKRIPLAGGLAGGSADAAAVILGLNKLLELHLNLEELYKIGEKLGQDIPFCIMNQAYSNKELGFSLEKGSCAFAYGKGESLTALYGIKGFLVLSKPKVGVSTAEVYKAMDQVNNLHHPNTEKLIEIFKEKSQGNREKLEAIKVWGENVMETYTLSAYKEAATTKKIMEIAAKNGKVMMSGSGPTVYLLTVDEKEAKEVYLEAKKTNEETFLTETI